MNSILSLPVTHNNNNNRKMSFAPSPMTGRKRKAEDDDRMSASPSPNISSQQLPTQRPIKKVRAGPAGRALTLPRLLETLDAESLRNVLKHICDAHPLISEQITHIAPKPSVTSALEVLHRYEADLRNAFPFGGDPGSDYAYNRVKQQQTALLEALGDFCPHFLPPTENQVPTCLEFLDGATDIIHRLPDWHSFQNNLAKHNAYEEIARAWGVVVKEAEKKAAGISLRYDTWDKKLLKHNQLAQGRLQLAVDDMNQVLGWTGGGGMNSHPGRGDDGGSSVVQELLSGTYGSNVPVRVGPW